MKKDKVIHVDIDVVRAIQDKAIELGVPLSTPNNVLRLLMNLPPLKGQRHQPIKIDWQPEKY